MAASAARIQILRERKLSIAFVDTQPSTQDRNQFRAALLTSFQNAIDATVGADVRVRSVVVRARDAQLKLTGGEYDAALVIGSNRPLALHRIDLVTIAGSLPTDGGPQPVCLIIANGDEQLTRQLRAAFARLLTYRAINGRPSSPRPKLPGAAPNFATITP